MLRHLPILATVAACFTLGGAPAALADTTSAETVRLHEVDFRGRPPFQRAVKEMPVAEVARLEAEQEHVTFTVKRSLAGHGKPPYRRVTMTLPVTDVARLELEPSSERQVDYSGRPPFRRH